ncbi:MAG: type IV secretion protein IcmT [Rhodospirillales bacterium]|nr:type IV secretion protein IcmT [Rhodospirillales bacterium]
MATAAERETAEEQTHWHWRNSMRPARFFALDARAVIPWFVLLVYARPITLFVTFISTVVFYILERKGLTFPSAIRSLRVWLLGHKRPGLVAYRRHRMNDFG